MQWKTVRLRQLGEWGPRLGIEVRDLEGEEEEEEEEEERVSVVVSLSDV